MSFQQTIFLIDRDVAANELLARNFEAHEFMVHTATTAEELLQMVRTKRADLIILGVDLPDMDGRDACRLLRKRGLLTPVLIVSDAASDADTILGLDSGANDYIVKPVKFPSLLARVRAHLRTSEANSTQSSASACANSSRLTESLSARTGRTSSSRKRKRRFCAISSARVDGRFPSRNCWSRSGATARRSTRTR